MFEKGISSRTWITALGLILYSAVIIFCAGLSSVHEGTVSRKQFEPAHWVGAKYQASDQWSIYLQRCPKDSKEICPEAVHSVSEQEYNQIKVGQWLIVPTNPGAGITIVVFGLVLLTPILLFTQLKEVFNHGIGVTIFSVLLIVMCLISFIFIWNGTQRII